MELNKKIEKQFDIKISFFEDGAIDIKVTTKKCNLVLCKDLVPLLTGITALNEKILKHIKENQSGMDDILKESEEFKTLFSTHLN